MPKTTLKLLLKYKYYYLLLLPGILYFVIFRYLPMVGIVVAFKNYRAIDARRKFYQRSYKAV